MGLGRDMTVAVVGTGIGGTELAGYLGLSGFRVRTHDVREDAVSGIRDRGGIEVSGVLTGFAPVERATTSLAEAIDGADLIAVATLHNDHPSVARELAPLLRDGQAVCIMTGYLGGSLQFRRLLRDHGCKCEVLLGEMDSFPFTGQILAPARLLLASIKKLVNVAALPSVDSKRLADLIRLAFPGVSTATDVLQTGLSKVGGVWHVPGMVANMGRIESGVGFQYYGEGITPSVIRVMEVVDSERMAIAKAFGAEVPTLREWLLQTYGLEGGTLYELTQRLQRDIFKNSPAPGQFGHRYVTEDVPYGLVPLVELGRVADVPTPNCSSLVVIASSALSRDFGSEGRTLEQMGLAGLSVPEIRSIVTR